MWNRNYEEAIESTSKIWTVMMQIDKPETQFAKTKVLQIIIERTLSLVLSNTKEAKRWLIILKSLDNNGIMTAILDMK
jgi:hypothetical protein